MIRTSNLRRRLWLSAQELAMLFAFTATSAGAQSAGISLFRSDITVRQDARLEVREEFTLDSGGKYYRYGFIRNLPITSQDRWDPKYVGEYTKDNGIRVKILEVTRDGRAIAYEQGSGYGYSQLRIGERNLALSAGEHRYVIRYSVTRALSFNASGDTLYWNAIGHERDVPVADAILCVHLPEGIPTENIIVEPRVAGRGVSFPRKATTGLERIDEGAGTIAYRATNVEPRQSLSIAVTWPSGFVRAPKFAFLTEDQQLLAAPVLCSRPGC